MAIKGESIPIPGMQVTAALSLQIENRDTCEAWKPGVPRHLAGTPRADLGCGGMNVEHRFEVSTASMRRIVGPQVVEHRIEGVHRLLKFVKAGDAAPMR